MESYAVFGGGGIGDLLGMFSYSNHVESLVNYYVCARDEVFLPIQYLYPEKTLFQLPEQFADNFAKAPEHCRAYVNQNNKEDRIIITWPDLLDRHPNSFPFKDYRLTPKRLKTYRNLTHKWVPEDRIFLGLASTTEGYMHSNTAALVKMIAKANSDYEIIFPTISKWANKNIDYGNLNDLPANVKWIQDRPLTTTIDYLSTCKLAVCLDNGPSHIAYHMGIPRILLDPRWGQLAWTARWRQDISESIPLSSSGSFIAKMTKILLEDQTLDFIPRIDLLNGIIKDTNWAQELIYKY